MTIKRPKVMPRRLPRAPTQPLHVTLEPQDLDQCGLAWPGLAWPGLAWPGLAGPGLALAQSLAWLAQHSLLSSSRLDWVFGLVWPGLAYLAWPDLALAWLG